MRLRATKVYDCRAVFGTSETAKLCRSVRSPVSSYERGESHPGMNEIIVAEQRF